MGEIDEIFPKKCILCDLPKPVRDLLELLKCASKAELSHLLLDNEVKTTTSTTCSHTWRKVSKVSVAILEEMRGCFLGEWTTLANNIFQLPLAKMCRAFPPECVVAECNGNLTYFYERNGDDVKLIVVPLKGALEHPAMVYLRTLMEELFSGHPKILRCCMATLQSHMTGFGPFWQRFESNGGTKVSFYPDVEKLCKILKNLPSAEDFEILFDRYAHNHLSALILALFMWKLPMLVHSFVNCSKPYLGADDYEASNLELILGGCGPCAYQLCIMKDFYSEIHKDADISKFTLAYYSHTDAA